ncbi:MAG: DDE-type integrase/transposase/recombinase [Candidatus Eisenbacteria bacterium]|nr:DDE-type integrase/transposase/recombinase [Candidatus Eisenbacteria bacterium]
MPAIRPPRSMTSTTRSRDPSCSPSAPPPATPSSISPERDATDPALTPVHDPSRAASLRLRHTIRLRESSPEAHGHNPPAGDRPRSGHRPQLRRCPSMIEDRSQPPKPTPRDWAVFRYSLISEATQPHAQQVVSQTLDRIAARQHQLPDGSLRRFSISTLRSWLRAYQHGGLDALVPKTRSDKGSFRCLDDDTAEIIARHRVQHRHLSVTLFHQILHNDGVLPDGRSLCEATLRRFLKARGLDKAVRGPGKARAKYEMPHPNDLWVGDFMHGPKVAAEKGKRKAILCAIIDDHSRVAVGARFAFSEDTADLLHTFRDAIGTHGVPKRFYCDNGPAFSSHHLTEACARIGCALLHSEPFDSPSRGKVERFFRTIRLRFLPRLTDDDLASLDILQDRLDQWLRDDYHLRRHGGINMKPLDRFLAGAEQTLIQRLAPQEIDHAFMGRLTRVVRNDATVKVDRVFYEVPPEFIGARVDLRFPVGRPEELFLYRDDQPVTAIRPVDPVDNARFHAQSVELSYAEIVRRRQEAQKETGRDDRQEVSPS